jgi:hypothetical protein
MQREYVEARTALVAFYGEGTRFVLHCKVISHRARTIANEIKRRGKAFHWEEFVKKVIEGALSILQVGEAPTVLNLRTNLENRWRAQV